MIFQSHTLNSVLHYLQSNPDSSIADYFYSKGKRDEKEIIDCRAKLKQDGYIIYYTIPDQKIKEILTSYAIQFIKKGGYNAEFNKVIEQETLVTKATQAAINILNKSSHSTPLIVQNKEKIDYAIVELDHISNLLDTDKHISILLLRSYCSNLGTLISNVFSKDHPIYISLNTLQLEKEIILQICNDAIHHLEFEMINLKTSLNGVHPKIIETSSQLYWDGHYRESISSAFAFVIDAMKAKFQITGKDGKLLDGKPLMEQVFSPNNPVFVVSNDISYQEGWKMLFAGSVSALRNKYVHDTTKITDADYALNLLHFASSLMRILEATSVY